MHRKDDAGDNDDVIVPQRKTGSLCIFHSQFQSSVSLRGEFRNDLFASRSVGFPHGLNDVINQPLRKGNRLAFCKHFFFLLGIGYLIEFAPWANALNCQLFMRLLQFFFRANSKTMRPSSLLLPPHSSTLVSPIHFGSTSNALKVQVPCEHTVQPQSLPLCTI